MRRNPTDVPRDDSAGPQLMTPRRLAARLMRVATGAQELACIVQEVHAYVDHAFLLDLWKLLATAAQDAGTARGEILTGDVLIVRARDEDAGKGRYPLIDAIEARNANGHAGDDWREVALGLLGLPRTVSDYFRAKEIVNAGLVQEWLDKHLSPERTAERLKHPDERVERTISAAIAALDGLRHPELIPAIEEASAEPPKRRRRRKEASSA